MVLPGRKTPRDRWRLSKRKSTSTAEARKATAQSLLKGLGESVYSDLDEGRFPSLTLASRSVRNIVYDKKLQQFILGATTVKKSSGNIKHIRPFTQLVWLAYFAKKLVDEKRTSTLRDVFYSAQAFDVEFQDQSESDELITDLEVLMQTAREGMNIYPEERSAIFGNMTIEYTVPGYEGKKADLSANPDGVMIGPALTTAEFAETDAEMVIAIEKGGLFTRFIEERVHQKYKAILINTAGQPPRSTRFLLRRLNQELGLPVGILCDADPWGAHIAMVCKSGSAGAAHLRELTTPDAVWLGVWASDIVKYKLPSDKLTDVDIKRLYELKQDPRYTEKMWHDELDVFLKIKKKSEQEAFARYGLSYIVDTYLPEKLQLMKSA
ncbi:MAG: DNA topoisomerase IV subunit A [Thaumarchaeota archaeon]|nr:DNA topoisomerase IV subunit A [Nitrososphaerota archaeon]